EQMANINCSSPASRRRAKVTYRSAVPDRCRQTPDIYTMLLLIENPQYTAQQLLKWTFFRRRQSERFPWQTKSKHIKFKCIFL
ncbi:hypothetical protein, partial [Mycobacterium tuberculosis]|uniref:hypothetical protein n=1 Tax=Mycobacterium tuberculosis TaxID=1773 RepID=UPI001BDFC4B7